MVVDDLMRKIAELFVQAQFAARAAARIHGLEEAASICDELARHGTWEHTLGAAECANRIREKIGKRPIG